MENINDQQLLERAMRLCARREICSSDLLARLTAWGAGESLSHRLLQILKEKNFVDDRRYALSYARQQHNLRKWGRIRIRMVLQQKNIPEAFIDEALQELDEEEYRQTLKEELKKKRKSLKGKNRYDLLARLQKFAYGRGYEPDLARKVAEEVVDQS